MIIISNYQESSKKSKEPSEIGPYLSKSIKRTIICIQIGSWTIEFAGAIKRRWMFVIVKNINVSIYTWQQGACDISSSSETQGFDYKLKRIPRTTTVKKMSKNKNNYICIHNCHAILHSLEYDAQILDNNNNSNHVEVVSPT